MLVSKILKYYKNIFMISIQYLYNLKSNTFINKKNILQIRQIVVLQTAEYYQRHCC